MKRIIIVSLMLVACTDEQNVGNTHGNTPVFGSTRWAITLGGLDEDRGMSVVVDPAGDVVAAGDFKGVVDFGNGPVSAHDYAAWISKRAGADGHALWTITVGTEPSAYADADRLAIDSQGNVIVAGSLSGDVALGQQIVHGPPLGTGTETFVAKFDPSGQLQWVNTLGVASISSAYGVGVGRNGWIAVVGVFQGTLQAPNGSFTGSDTTGYVALFGPDGTIHWAIPVPGVTGPSNQGVIVTDEDDVITSGNLVGPASIGQTTLQPIAFYSQYAARFTADGQVLWARVFGQQGVSHLGGGLALDGAGEILVSSTSRRDSDSAAVLDEHPTVDALDPNGQTLWNSEATSGEAQADAFTVTSDDRVITGGWVNGFSVDFGSGPLDRCVYLAAHNHDGEFLDGVSFVDRDTGCTDIIWGLASGPSGSIAFTGLVDRSPDFGTGALRFAGSTDAMIVLLDAAQ